MTTIRTTTPTPTTGEFIAEFADAKEQDLYTRWLKGVQNFMQK